MKKTAYIGLTIAMIAVLVGAAGLASAFIGGFNDPEQELIMQAAKNGDYDAWYQAMTDTLTEERFDKLVEMNSNKQAIEDAIQNNDYDAWVEAMKNTFTQENFDRLIYHLEPNPEGKPPRPRPMHRGPLS